jgi:putative membrane-bound dehydrogenase-like protein
MRHLPPQRVLRLFACLFCFFPWAVSDSLAYQLFSPPKITVAQGFEVRLAASSPIVGYPMMACLDDRGRLYVAESDGRNLTSREAIERELPRFVRQLVDLDGDGVFDKSTIFADRMTMPEGGLWHNGALYIISAPYLWRLEDLDDDGVADKRDKILGSMEFDGRANQHGPYLGPNGRLYFSGGHFGYDLVGIDGTRSGFSRAAGIFSCWPDGSDVQVEGQGGVNPVDIVFTANGDMLSTCAIFDSFGGQRHDALIHWMSGGLTQRVYGSPLLPDTGLRLPAVSRWGQVAPAGLMRYRGQSFGEAYRDTLFACQFNSHKVVHVRLEPRDGSFVTVEKDFLSSASVGFHPADILEDADGSLLLLDTGGWLSWGCPFSKNAKPEIKGAIYRIQRKGSPVQQDPRGLTLVWDSLEPEGLVQLLKDPRQVVRDRAAETLIEMGEVVLDEITSAISNSTETAYRKRCLWLVSRLGGKRGMEVLQEALLDLDPGMRQVAARSLGRLKNMSAVEPLARLLDDPSPFVQAAAATAIGQLGDKAALPSLFDKLDSVDSLHTRHAFVYALIEIEDPVGVASYLSDDTHPYRQRIALRVLAALGSDLAAAKVVPLLRSSDSNVRQEARRMISNRKELKDEILQVFRELVAEHEGVAANEQLIEGIVMAYAQDDAFQTILLEILASKEITSEVQGQVLAALGFLDDFPQPLEKCVLLGLNRGASEVREEALNIARRFEISQPVLAAVSLLAKNEDESPVTRASAMQVLAKHQGYLSDASFAFLVKLLTGEQTPVILGRQAAQALGSLRLHSLKEPQSDAMIQTIAGARSFYLPSLIRPFALGREQNAPEESVIDDAAWNLLGEKLAAALEQSPGLISLQPGQRQEIIKAFADANEGALAALSGVLKNGFSGQKEQESKIKSLLDILDSGNASHGRVLFHDQRVSCGACHRIEGQGGQLGPNLTKIGRIRQPRDLLEAILYPNSTVVNGYEHYVLETIDRESYGGIIQRETKDAIYLKNASMRNVRVARSQIHRVTISPISVMPSGLNQLLSQQELLDLVAFLQTCR